MSDPIGESPCQNCGELNLDTDLDKGGWCQKCRALVVKRSAIAARIVAALVLAAAAFWVFSAQNLSRFLILWLVLLLGLYALAYKITQRVAFELIRDRGVRRK